ncbi:hypothetical protein [Brumimicrobium glaciale]|uniref:hypothetical protein n=1 Tax=Brumimicrobium glaciale TaxID=200475 RepID=UPI0013EB489E|nr:hypothetical protein [Brumimicrobium glaciale]
MSNLNLKKVSAEFKKEIEYFFSTAESIVRVEAFHSQMKTKMFNTSQYEFNALLHRG